ncbi:Frizzled-10 [Balamuthia mandrillaris]
MAWFGCWSHSPCWRPRRSFFSCLFLFLSLAVALSCLSSSALVSARQSSAFSPDGTTREWRRQDNASSTEEDGQEEPPPPDDSEVGSASSEPQSNASSATSEVEGEGSTSASESASGAGSASASASASGSGSEPEVPPLPDNVFDPQVKGGQCVPIGSINSTGFAFDCKPYIPYNDIYMDDYFVQRQGNLRVLATPLPAECQRAMAQWLCLNYWRQCITITPNTKGSASGLEELNASANVETASSSGSREDYAVVGVYSCRNVCEEAREQCQHHSRTKWPSLLKEYLDCDNTHSGLFGRPNVKLFPRPQENYTYTLKTKNGLVFNASLPCSYAKQTRLLPTYDGPLVCPLPLHNELGGCVFGCPEPLLTSEQWSGITTMISVTAWLSFILMAFLTVSYLIDPQKRRFPNNLPLFFFLCILFFSFGLCISSLVGYKEVLCSDSNNAAYWGHETCTIQGILIVYFMFAAMSWWLLIAFNLLAHLMSARTQYELTVKKRKTVMMAAYHGFAWLFPLIPMIIALSAHRIGSNGATLWCGIHSASYESQIRFFTTPNGVEHNSGGEQRYWFFFLFLTPLSLMVVLGIVMIGAVIGYQLKRQRTIQDIWRFCRNEWRVVAFLGLYVWVCIFLASFEISFVVERSKRNDNYQDYIDCLLVQQQTELIGEEVTPAPPSAIANSSADMSTLADAGACVLDRVTNFPLWVIAAFNFVGHGLFVFLIFGTTKRIYLVWWRIIRCRSLPGNTISGDGGGSSIAAAAAVAFSLEDIIGADYVKGDDEELGKRRANSSNSDEKRRRGNDEVKVKQAEWISEDPSEIKPAAAAIAASPYWDSTSYDEEDVEFTSTSISTSSCCCSSDEDEDQAGERGGGWEQTQKMVVMEQVPADKPQPHPLNEEGDGEEDDTHGENGKEDEGEDESEEEESEADDESEENDDKQQNI